MVKYAVNSIRPETKKIVTSEEFSFVKEIFYKYAIFN